MGETTEDDVVCNWRINPERVAGRILARRNPVAAVARMGKAWVQRSMTGYVPGDYLPTENDVARADRVDAIMTIVISWAK